ncbi:MAG: carboxypeptidase regulatory-like domain-containing protein [Euryarchaeota archaeon]|nr:carboxypeptidase regulatory-like domain-containing protein [Euryarchaeota archaeon]
MAAPASAADDVGSLRGLVTDDEQRPIAGVEVTLAEIKATTTTDAAGRFTFNDLAPATYSVFFARLGYDALARKVEVKAGEVIDLNVVMEGIPVGLTTST